MPKQEKPEQAAEGREPEDSRYYDWQDDPCGDIAREAVDRLARRMTSGWPRRGHNLIELFCADGYFLETFWQSGFDVTGQDQSAELLEKARSRLKNTADLTQAHPEHLPFDDRSFDYVVCILGMEFAENPPAMVREMFRLATRGVLLAFPSSWSLHGVGRFLGRRRVGQRFFSPISVDAMIRRADESGVGKVSWGSTLLGPGWTWKRPGLSRVNFAAGPLPVGAVSMVRVDFNPPLGASHMLVAGKSRLRRETATSSMGRIGK